MFLLCPDCRRCRRGHRRPSLPIWHLLCLCERRGWHETSTVSFLGINPIPSRVCHCEDPFLRGIGGWLRGVFCPSDVVVLFVGLCLVLSRSRLCCHFYVMLQLKAWQPAHYSLLGIILSLLLYPHPNQIQLLLLHLIHLELPSMLCSTALIQCLLRQILFVVGLFQPSGIVSINEFRKVLTGGIRG